MWGRSIQSFRHLELQNQFIISDSIGRARMVQQFWIGGRAGGGVQCYVLELGYTIYYIEHIILLNTSHCIMEDCSVALFLEKKRTLVIKQ